MYCSSVVVFEVAFDDTKAIATHEVIVQIEMIITSIKDRRTALDPVLGLINTDDIDL